MSAEGSVLLRAIIVAMLALFSSSVPLLSQRPRPLDQQLRDDQRRLDRLAEANRIGQEHARHAADGHRERRLELVGEDVDGGRDRRREQVAPALTRECVE